MPRVKFAKKKAYNYEHHTVSSSFGAGPLRARAILEKSYGKCASCGLPDELRGGRCDFCRWMANDKEISDRWDKLKG